MKANIAAATVLYNPDKSFLQNIDSYAPFVSLLIIVDNSENPDRSFYDRLVNEEKTKLIVYNENKGIATALNDATKIALEQGFDWILTMDQDSRFEKQMIEKYLADFAAIPDKQQVAVIGPVFEKSAEKKEDIKYVSSLITSGSLVNTRIWNELGGFNEQLFIDEVDHEYCYRAGLRGYKIIQLQQVFLQHSLGKQQYVTTIAGEKNKLKSFHAPIRLYYIVRNSCYVISIYKKSFPGEMKLKRKDVLVRLKNNFLYGNRKMEVIKYAIRGYIDWKRNRFGKYR